MEDPMIRAYADLMSRLPRKRLSKEEVEGFAKSFAGQEACAAPESGGVAKETGARMIGAAAAAAERRQKKQRE